MESFVLVILFPQIARTRDYSNLDLLLILLVVPDIYWTPVSDRTNL